MKLVKFFLMLGTVLLGMQTVAFANQNDTDGEIIAVLMEANTQEINDADLALQKNVNPRVKAFADMMKKDHSKSLTETKDLSKSLNIAPIETSKVKDLKQKGQEGYKKLSGLDGHDFEVAYADMMVKCHDKMLSFLDDSIKKTQNTSLKNYLMKVRDIVKMHLDHAKALQTEVNKK